MKTDKPFYNSTIPSDWTTPEFGEMFTFLKSYSFSREQLSDEKTTGEVQNIHYGDIHATFEDEILDFEIEKRIPFVKDGLISTDKLSDEEFPFLKDGDLIIADASEDTIGVAECVELKNVNGRKIVSGLHTFAARDEKGKTVPGYRTYLLRHPQVIRELRRIATGFSVFGISKTNLTKVRLPLPPHNEQEAFAELLNLMDTTINKNNQLIAKKEQQKKWLMWQLLTGRKRLKGFEKSKWKIYSLDKLIKPTVREVPKPSVPYLALGIRSHGKGTFLKPNEDPEKNDMDKLYVVRKDDLIVNITFAWEHAIAVANERDEGALVSHRFPTYTFIKDKSDATFFRFFILQTRMKYEMQLISPGGAGRNRVLDKSDFLKLEFSIPDYEEQVAIGKILQAADKEIQLLKDKTIKLREKKKGLMQQLLTGKKRLLTKGK